MVFFTRFGWGRWWVWCVAGLVLPSLGVHGPSSTAHAAMAGSTHDFTSKAGYAEVAGGGVCTICHVPHGALDSRLYPRVPTASGTAPLRLCLDCHLSATKIIGGKLTLTPVPMPTDHGNGSGADWARCTKCHIH